MKRIILIALFISTATLSLPATVSVRILTTKVIDSFIFSPLEGNYTIYGDGIAVAECDASGIFQMSLDKDSVLLKTFEKTIGKYAMIRIYSLNQEAAFKIKSVIPDSKVRTYEGNIEVSLTADKKQFLLINKVDLEKYIGGVVESESGTKTSIE